ncbi:MAG: PAS domain-containing sensor histidine kinase [Bacteroidales bacterium]|nr:PAS domain-containing sensor histidine kinase [Bacteroidales bacterium]
MSVFKHKALKDKGVESTHPLNDEIFRLLIDQSKDGYYITDAVGLITFANQGLADILGVASPDKLTGNSLFDYIPNETVRNEFRNNFLAGKSIPTIRTIIKTDQGKSIFIKVKPLLLLDKGKTTGSRGIVHNITFMINADQELREKEKRYYSLFENANDAIFTMNGEVFTNCNQMTVSMFGCNSKEDIIGHFPWEFSPEVQPDGRNSNESAKEKIEAALHGNPQRFYWKHCTKDQVPFDAEVSLNRVDTDHDVSLQAIVRDISEQKRVEKTLNESEERFRSLFDNVVIGMYRTTPDGQILMANKAIVNMLGYQSFGELQNRNMEDEGFGPSYSRKQFKEIIEKEGSILGNETVWIKNNREPIHVRESAKVVRNEAGRVLYYEGTIEDISDRKEVEIRLKESELRLQQLIATKDKFFSIIAHDLKSPFNSILGFSNILVEEAKTYDRESIEKFAHIIHQSSVRAMNLLTNLLDWSRTQTGRMNFNPEYFELVTLVNSTLQLLEESATQKSLTISTDLPSNLPIMADKEMIGTVLRNLISNAIKFTYPNGEIRIKAVENQDELLVIISDTGIGMDNSSINKLFKIEESNSEKGTNNEKGTGLGLLLCHEFIQKHNGRIWVESEKGIGSTFYFSLPMN